MHGRRGAAKREDGEAEEVPVTLSHIAGGDPTSCFFRWICSGSCLALLLSQEFAQTARGSHAYILEGLSP